MLLLLLVTAASAHLVQNRVDYPIVVDGGEQCIETLEPGQDVEIDVTPGDVISVKNNLGMLIGKFFIWGAVHNTTVFDGDFQRVQRCEDNVKDKRCSLNRCLHGKGWMQVMCARTCASCHLQAREIRCNETQLGITQTSMIPGFLDRTVQNGLENYNGELLNTDPPIIQLHDFLSEDDVEEMLRFAIRADLKRSTGQGKVDASGVQEKKEIFDRTSTNAWCSADCEALPSMKRLKAKTSALTNVSSLNFEAAQILRYEEGQYYATHNDIGELDFTSSAGPRIFTLFVYLNDVAEGGETGFPRLGNIVVKPKAGSVVLWSSVKEVDGVFSKDDRTDHEAKPPLNGGLKFGMNLWVHARDFGIANQWGCTGSFG
jgi:hypothetical protein